MSTAYIKKFFQEEQNMLQYEKNLKNVTPHILKAYLNTLSMAFRFILIDEYGFTAPYTGAQRRIYEELIDRYTGANERIDAAGLRVAASLLADKYGFASLRRSMCFELDDWYESCANAKLLLQKGTCSKETANKIYRAAREAAAKMILNLPDERDLLYTERMLNRAAAEVLHADADDLLLAWTHLMMDIAEDSVSAEGYRAYNGLSPAMRCAFKLFTSQMRR